MSEVAVKLKIDNCSFFKTVKHGKGETMSLPEIYQGIGSGKWNDYVMPGREIKRTGTDDEYRAYKLGVPAFSPAILYKETSDSKSKYTDDDLTGRMPFDLDDKNQDDDKVRELLKKD